jgi:hypothetical protein
MCSNFKSKHLLHFYSPFTAIEAFNEALCWMDSEEAGNLINDIHTLPEPNSEYVASSKRSRKPRVVFDPSMTEKASENGKIANTVAVTLFPDEDNASNGKAIDENISKDVE